MEYVSLSETLELLNLDSEDKEDLKYAKDICQLSDLLINNQRAGYIVDAFQQALRAGPLADGDLLSKAGRDFLLEEGLMTKILVNGEQGYQALTYKAFDLKRIYYIAHERAVAFKFGGKKEVKVNV